VTGIEFKGHNQYDNDWVDFVMALESTEGQATSHYFSIPTTARNSFMFGSKKSLAEYSKLEKLLRGFGVILEYSTAINQIAQLFDDPVATFVGKQVSMRLGYNSNSIKFIGKDGDVTLYSIVDKNNQEVIPMKFAGFESAEQYAKDNNIKIQGFIRVQEVLAAETASISLVQASSDLPF
jgi:hypothetical protein